MFSINRVNTHVMPCVLFLDRIILGIMVPTWLLSMWMSNTSATLMMLTITEAMLEKIDEVTGRPGFVISHVVV